MKEKKVLVIICIIVSAVITAFSACHSTTSQNSGEINEPILSVTTIVATQVPTEEPEEETIKTTEEPYSEEEFISQRIENYTKEYFRFTEYVQVETENGMISVTVAFKHEVGSVVIKEDVYESIAVHAYQITEFFPEVTYFYYKVLSQDDNTKDEAMCLTIDKEAVSNLELNYYNQIMRRNSGFDTVFSEVFSEIVETEESRTWMERIDTDAEIP